MLGETTGPAACRCKVWGCWQGACHTGQGLPLAAYQRNMARRCQTFNGDATGWAAGSQQQNHKGRMLISGGTGHAHAGTM